MKIAKKTAVSLLIVILAVFPLFVSCNAKLEEVAEIFEETDESEPDIIITANNTERMLSSFTANPSQEFVPEASTLEKELIGLDYILSPFLDKLNPNHVGDNNKDYLNSYVLNPDNALAPVPVPDWEKAVRILFSFDKEDDRFIKMYITDFSSGEYIKRQYAVSGLMNLLSLRYPLSSDEDPESLKKSEILTDLDSIDDKHRNLVCQAFCLGFTDFTVEEIRAFRPDDPLTKAESISMFYRILVNLGLPAAEPVELPADEAFSVSSVEEIQTPAEDEKAFYTETIWEEYTNYLDKQRKSGTAAAEKRIKMLKQAEAIFGIDNKYSRLNEPLDMNQWVTLINQVFGIERNRIIPYVSYETDGTLPYDIAAICIFKLFDPLGGYESGDATPEELEAAREAIPQFDTARDTSKFARMFTSGLLEGLYRIPGFTPQRPVNKAEALLLVKRMIENMDIK